ncbi:BRCT domain-containing protein [Leptospira paudalimensis]|uniref:BRCT domain-containing protein n=1 Tax=Leptospira paudalimensis TaxID=2950024 RepID=A0ABT3MCK8_9LEPT|nr:hypothetical protein [Leptospira paudalimensis]MCW7506124.1 hypothetical protein [Leptospira paudalimensis]
MKQKSIPKISDHQNAFNTLQGLLIGISLDQKLNQKEVSEINFWLNESKDLINKKLYSEIVSILEFVVKSGKFTDEEKKDLLFICEKFNKSNPAFDLVHNDMQVLHGILHGILADGKITLQEAQSLKKWLYQNEQLASAYPYDELLSLLTGILADGKIDKEEQAILKIFLSEFINLEKSKNLDETKIETLKTQFTVPGICALAPEIIPEDHVFSFTGIPSAQPISEIEKVILENGGIFSNPLRKDTSYLIVGGNMSNCWTFSCFGRKVEEAIEMRKSGSHILIIHEVDFWDNIA